MELYQLTVNHQASPIGVDAALSPYFGWKIRSKINNTRQAAYRLQLFSHDDCCWDSNMIESSDNAFICCPAPLQPHTAYQWRVTVRDNHGNEATAESSFETALGAYATQLCAAPKRLWHAATRHAVPQELYACRRPEKSATICHLLRRL